MILSIEPTRTIGLILASVVANFRDSLLEGLSNQFHEKGYRLIMGLTDHSIDREKEYLEQFASITDCIIVVSSAEKYEDIAPAISGDVPVLFLLNKPEDCPYTCILESDYSAIYQAVVSCTNMEHVKVGCICSHRELSSTKEFLRAYKDAMSASPASYSEDLIYDIENDMDFNVHELVLDMAYKGCSTILAATPAITNRIIDYLVFYNTNPLNTPISLFGYGTTGNSLSSQMNIDVIMHPVNQLVNLTVQQAIYLINHPDYTNQRDFLIKGSLRMHTYDGLHTLKN